MKRLSPFEQLLRAIENEVFNLALSSQSKEKMNTDFVIGYRCALNVLLEKAYAIRNRRFPADFITLDETKEETTKRLLEALKRD